MFLLPLLTTLLSSLISLLGRFLGHRGVSISSVVLLFLATVSSFFVWYEVVLGASEVFVDVCPNLVQVGTGSWFAVGSYQVS